MMAPSNASAVAQWLSPADCNVLVVDDDELVRAQLVSLLQLAGYQVHSARSGAQALLLLGTRPCQLVLTDWEMPDMDGATLCRALRLRDSERYTYIMMLTVRNSAADILAGFAAGADDYLLKTASRDELLARIEVGRRITHLQQSLRASDAENSRLTVTDPLTGAHNRRFLMKFLPRELARARRYSHPLALLSCDIDEFKLINDCLGNDAGDEVLKAFVLRTMNCTRNSIDWIARSGGEEFAVVLPETTLAGASRVAEKVRLALADSPVLTGAGPVGATVSIGVTALETPELLAKVSAEELLRAADCCLDASKSRGKDRSTSSPPDQATVLSLGESSRPKHRLN